MSQPLTVALAGDLMLERPITPAGGGRSPGSAAVWEVFHQADLVFVNLEVPLTSRGAPADKHVAFRADPRLAGDLRAAGIDVVTLANNHMLDYGPDGLFDTLETLRQTGLPAVGAGRTLAEALAPAVLTARGARVAFLGLASTLPVGSAAAPDRPGIAPVHVTTLYVVDNAGLDETPGKAPYVETRCWPGDVEVAAEAVAQAKRQADVVVVGVHWGVPHGFVAAFQNPVAGYQRPLAEALIDAGADVVVGHHPHVLHGIDVINGRPVFYSLGNFLFHSVTPGRFPTLRRPDPPYSWKSLRSPVNLDSVIALVRCDAGGVHGVELVPVVMNADGDPELATGTDAARILTSLAEQSTPYGVTITSAGDRGQIALHPAGVAR
ncbi:MAG: CapA family protein [Armatimonadota bacterium]|nr:CapA family protein [Armatimonadota bacterium]MDR7534183.1 CapA family protein [Armatimonadota bacterium]MDR7537642.1 CapA family protein [Armatimonadota bacterium]